MVGKRGNGVIVKCWEVGWTENLFGAGAILALIACELHTFCWSLIIGSAREELLIPCQPVRLVHSGALWIQASQAHKKVLMATASYIPDRSLDGTTPVKRY